MTGINLISFSFDLFCRFVIIMKCNNDGMITQS